jgi:hypothetical protein
MPASRAVVSRLLRGWETFSAPSGPPSYVLPGRDLAAGLTCDPSHWSRPLVPVAFPTCPSRLYHHVSGWRGHALGKGRAPRSWARSLVPKVIVLLRQRTPPVLPLPWPRRWGDPLCCHRFRCCSPWPAPSGARAGPRVSSAIGRLLAPFPPRLARWLKVSEPSIVTRGSATSVTEHDWWSASCESCEGETRSFAGRFFSRRCCHD